MKQFLLLALITCLIGFSSCSKESEEIVSDTYVNLALVHGSYTGTYTNTSGNIGSLVTTTDNYYQVKIVSDLSNKSISIEGLLDNNISLVTTTLSTDDGILYTGSLAHPDMRYFSFNVNTKKINVSLYQNDEQKKYEGIQQ